MLTPEEWKKLEEMYKFWDEQTFAEMNLGYWPEEVKRVLYPAGFRKIIQMESYETAISCLSPDIKMLLAKGLNGIMNIQ